MSAKGRTPDEKFLIRLYEMALQQGDLLRAQSIEAIARSLGQRSVAMKTIVRDLAQANFVKKSGDSHVIITQLGCRFVEEEIGDQN